MPLSSWTTQATMAGFQSFQCVPYGDRYYFIGGLYNSTTLKTVRSYDSTGKNIINHTASPVGWQAAGACTDGYDIYYGVGTNGTAGQSAWYRYSPNSDSHTQLASCPIASSNSVAASDGKYVYLAIGSTKAAKYNIATDTWTMLPDLGTGRFLMSMVYYAGYMYVFGGNGLASAERLNVAGGATSWEPITSMATSRKGMSACIVDGLIYLVGGASTSVQVYNPKSDTYRADTSLPVIYQGGCVTAVMANASTAKLVYWTGSDSGGVARTDSIMSTVPATSVGDPGGSLFGYTGWGQPI